MPAGLREIVGLVAGRPDVFFRPVCPNCLVCDVGNAIGRDTKGLERQAGGPRGQKIDQLGDPHHLNETDRHYHPGGSSGTAH